VRIYARLEPLVYFSQIAPTQFNRKRFCLLTQPSIRDLPFSEWLLIEKYFSSSPWSGVGRRALPSCTRSTSNDSLCRVHSRHLAARKVPHFTGAGASFYQLDRFVITVELLFGNQTFFRSASSRKWALRYMFSKWLRIIPSESPKSGISSFRGLVFPYLTKMSIKMC